MITEDYVSFETAKLLKEKGFNEYCLKNYWSSDKKLHDWGWDLSYNRNRDGNSNTRDCAAPTHQMAMKLLREVYKLHITIKPYITIEGIMYVFEIYKLKSDRFTLLKTKAGFEKSEEAVDAAIKDSIENLI